MAGGERLSISITGEASDFVSDYIGQNDESDLSNLDVVKRGLRLLKFVNDLGPNQTLCVQDADRDGLIEVPIPWSVNRSQLAVPDL